MLHSSVSLITTDTCMYNGGQWLIANFCVHSYFPEQPHVYNFITPAFIHVHLNNLCPP